MLDIEITHDLDGVVDFADSIGKQLDNPNLRLSAANLIKGFKGVISGGRLAPLMASTVEIREKRGRSGSSPLKDSGKLQRSITAISFSKSNAVLGSRLAQAAFLRKGGRTSSRSAIGGKRVASRDFMPVSQKDLEVVGKSILDSLKG